MIHHVFTEHNTTITDKSAISNPTSTADLWTLRSHIASRLVAPHGHASDTSATCRLRVVAMVVKLVGHFICPGLLLTKKDWDQWQMDNLWWSSSNQVPKKLAIYIQQIWSFENEELGGPSLPQPFQPWHLGEKCLKITVTHASDAQTIAGWVHKPRIWGSNSVKLHCHPRYVWKNGGSILKCIK